MPGDTDMYRVTVQFSGTGVAGGGVSQWYYDLAGGTAAQAVTTTRNFWSALLAYMGSGLNITTLSDVEQVDPKDAQIIVTVPGSGGTSVASGAGDTCPMATQGLVQWRTGAYSDGREIRGRTFLPSPLETHNTAGVPASAYTTAVNTAAAAVIADTNSTFVIWRRPRKARPQVGNPGDPWYLPAQAARDGEWAPATLGNTWSKWATLRSRRD